VLVAIIAPFLVFHPTITRAATVTVLVGKDGGLSFTPSSVMIHTGDSVLWMWSSSGPYGSGHSSTSGSPGMPSGLWDSGILKQGATFMHTFSTAGSFSYYCTVHGSCCGMVGAVIVSNSTPTPSPTATPTPTPSRLNNISTRASVQTGSGATIAGFILTGTELKQVVVRGLGPTLTQFGVSGALADPTLQLFDGNGKTLFINNNWKDTQQAGIQATGLAPPNDLESAIRIALQPGHYTAALSGNNGTTGVGLMEVYDIETAVSTVLTNVSTRGFVGTDQNAMIGGFIIEGGNGSTEVVVRGLGPTLTQFGVTGALADPALTLVKFIS
jgi:plastocyanin